MKRLLLPLSSALFFAAQPQLQAQVTLTGNNYSQDFNAIGTGYPTGWSGYTGAGTAALGTAQNLTTAATPWNNTTGAFKNVASVQGLNAGDASGVQNSSANRALGIRQGGSFGDPGAAFTFHIDNTTGMSAFQLELKLMSCDVSSPRTTTWQVQYAVGATPTSFTTIVPASGTLTTGNSTFGASTISIDFGTALNNKPDNVWIRIVTLTASGGTGNRATSAIDDFNLTWQTNAPTDYRPNIVALSPLNNASNLALNTPLTIEFDREIVAGSGNIIIKNETDQTANTIAANSADVSISGRTATIQNIGLQYAKTYHVTFDDNAFDTSTYHAYGISDTTAWRFSTLYTPYASINEPFDAACNSGGIPANWQQRSVTGAQIWACNATSGTSNKYVTINGYSGGAVENEDYLITPVLDLSASANPELVFRNRYTRSGLPLEVLISTDYDVNSASPATATWTNLSVSFNIPADSNLWNTKTVNLSAYRSQPVVLAFKYGSTTIEAAKWDVDSVVVYDRGFYPEVVQYTPANGSNFVATAAPLQITFNRGVSAGTGSIYITNETLNTTATIAANSPAVQYNGNQVSITTTLNPATYYHVTYDADAFDTADYHASAVTDTFVWRFRTMYLPYTALTETFEDACNSGGIPADWLQKSVTGAQTWACSGTTGTGNKYATVFGNVGSGASATPVENEDWLITPVLNIINVANPVLVFKSRFTRSGAPLQVLVSSDYQANAAPGTATWTDLGITFNMPADSNTWVINRSNLNAYQNSNFVIAFKYTATNTEAAKWDIDSVSIFAGGFTPVRTSVSPANGAVNVAVNTPLEITFDRGISAAAGNIYLKDETAQSTITIPANDAAVSYNANVISINASLALGKIYHVTYDADAFDTAGFHAAALSDTSLWRFSTAPLPPVVVTGINENFDNACVSGGIPANWTTFDALGAQKWSCNATSGTSNKYLTIFGSTGTGANATPVENEDWLITPKCDFSGYNTVQLLFKSRFTRTGDTLRLLVSQNFDGISNPNTATWTQLPVTFYMTADSNSWKTKVVDLSAYRNQNLHVAFKYNSTGTQANKWDIDSVVTITTTNISDVKTGLLDFKVLGLATSTQATLEVSCVNAGTYQVLISDLSGRSVSQQQYRFNSGKQTLSLPLPSLSAGMYLLQVVNKEARSVQKMTVQ